jgi:hypothetical protein
MITGTPTQYALRLQNTSYRTPSWIEEHLGMVRLKRYRLPMAKDGIIKPVLCFERDTQIEMRIVQIGG